MAVCFVFKVQYSIIFKNWPLYRSIYRIVLILFFFYLFFFSFNHCDNKHLPSSSAPCQKYIDIISTYRHQKSEHWIDFISFFFFFLRSHQVNKFFFYLIWSLSHWWLTLFWTKRATVLIGSPWFWSVYIHVYALFRKATLNQSFHLPLPVILKMWWLVHQKAYGVTVSLATLPQINIWRVMGLDRFWHMSVCTLWNIMKWHNPAAIPTAWQQDAWWLTQIMGTM